MIYVMCGVVVTDCCWPLEAEPNLCEKRLAEPICLGGSLRRVAWPATEPQFGWPFRNRCSSSSSVSSALLPLLLYTRRMWLRANTFLVRSNNEYYYRLCTSCVNIFGAGENQ